ncbi:MAG TPA: hypothetical protein VIU64_04300, partial [Polyangia bacterium]
MIKRTTCSCGSCSLYRPSRSVSSGVTTRALLGLAALALASPALGAPAFAAGPVPPATIRV